MQMIVGELYLNWGWAGVVDGMIVLGMIFGLYIALQPEPIFLLHGKLSGSLCFRRL